MVDGHQKKSNKIGNFPVYTITDGAKLCRPYTDYVKNEQKILDFVKNQDKGVVWILQHKKVYTIGRSQLSSALKLSKIGVDVFETKRGGLSCFHEPGQFVCYVFLNVKKWSQNSGFVATELVSKIEDVMLKTCLEFGLKVFTSKNGRGIWAKKSDSKLVKIGFVGISISKNISSNGFCINIINDCDGFKKIDPCGFKDIEISSIAKQIKNDIDFDKVNLALLKNIISSLDLLEYKNFESFESFSEYAKI